LSDDTLKTGKILLVDELESSLHPMLTILFISLVNGSAVNKKGAQLLFTMHDTNLLNQKLFHKSQIWFTEKDPLGATHLTSLVEFKGIRPEDNIEKAYIQDKFGAVPYLGSFREVFIYTSLNRSLFRTLKSIIKFSFIFSYS
jgi:AAA15 family ATPase/GTPase